MAAILKTSIILKDRKINDFKEIKFTADINHSHSGPSGASGNAESFSNNEMKNAISNTRDTPQSAMSSTRKELLERTTENKKYPLPTTGKATRIAISCISKMLSVFKNDIILGQKISNGLCPSIDGTVISRTMVQRLNFDFDGFHDYNSKNNREITMFKAEFISNSANSGEAKKRVILYIHGGAYCVSSRKTHRMITSRLCKYADALVFAMDYRLAPQHVFPAPLVDVLSAYKHLLNLGFLAKNMAFAGDSCGGSLALSAMLCCRDSGSLPLPACLSLISPYLDLTQSLPSWKLNDPFCFLPEKIEDLRHLTENKSHIAIPQDEILFHPYISNIFAKSDSKMPIPPTLIQVGDAERVRDDGIYFKTQTMPTERIQVELFQDAAHAFPLFSQFSRFAQHALIRMGAFIKEHTPPNGIIPHGREYKSVRIMNDKKQYPTAEIPDLNGILSDGIDLCISSGIWHQKGTTITI